MHLSHRVPPKTSVTRETHQKTAMVHRHKIAVAPPPSPSHPCSPSQHPTCSSPLFFICFGRVGRGGWEGAVGRDARCNVTLVVMNDVVPRRGGNRGKQASKRDLCPKDILIAALRGIQGYPKRRETRCSGSKIADTEAKEAVQNQYALLFVVYNNSFLYSPLHLPFRSKNATTFFTCTSKEQRLLLGGKKFVVVTKAVLLWLGDG